MTTSETSSGKGKSWFYKLGKDLVEVRSPRNGEAKSLRSLREKVGPERQRLDET